MKGELYTLRYREKGIMKSGFVEATSLANARIVGQYYCNQAFNMMYINVEKAILLSEDEVPSRLFMPPVPEEVVVPDREDLGPIVRKPKPERPTGTPDGYEPEDLSTAPPEAVRKAREDADARELREIELLADQEAAIAAQRQETLDKAKAAQAKQPAEPVGKKK